MAYNEDDNKNMNENMPDNQENSEQDAQKEEEKEATKEALEVGAKAIGMAYGGPAGAAVADTIANSSEGQKVLNEGAEKLNKVPGVAKKTRDLKNSGKLDEAKMAMDLMDSNLSSGASEVANAANSAEAANAANNAQIADAMDMANKASQNNANSKNNAGDNTPASSDSSDNKKESKNSKNDDTNNSDLDSSGKGKVSIPKIVKTILITAPLFLLIMLLLSILVAIGGVAGDFDDAISAYAETGGDTGGMVYEPSSKEAKAFYERIREAKSSMESEGEELDIIKLVAVYHIINRGDSKYDYDYFTTSRLREIAREITTDKEETKNNLANNIFPKYFPKNSSSANKQMAEEVYEYIASYNSIMGIQEEENLTDDDDCSGGTGVCTYDIKGFHINSSIHKKKMNITNLKVRLMQCGSYGNGNDKTPIKQSLVKFEDYAAGVSYAEIGSGYPKAAQQAQMIMARSYGLARPTAMNNAAGKKLGKEKGKWILQIASCVSDQVYCDINEGCSYMGGDAQGGYVVIGTNKPGSVRSKDPLPANSKTRKYANEVQGKLLVDKKGYVVSTPYTSKQQKQIQALAKSGKDYKQILLKMYPAAADIYTANCGQTNCSDDSGGGSTGNFAKWKQWDKRWASTRLGPGSATLGRVGCLVTSAAILIAKSGVSTNIKPFNPGTFAQALNKVGGLDGSGSITSWNAITSAVPNFKFVGEVNLVGKSKSQKLAEAKKLEKKGYYVIAEVKGRRAGSMHWVAIDKVRSDSILIMDPGYNQSKLWNSFYVPERTTTFLYFKASK
ncbi:MAG: hypothetical protein IJI43_04505 [Bacilli bacterium]|nr:hypothetical protein [Bacilli bacterium]